MANDSKKNILKLYKYFAYKSIQIIIQSRLGEKISSYSKPFAYGQDWFNISILNLPDVNQQIIENLLIPAHVYDRYLCKITNIPNSSNIKKCKSFNEPILNVDNKNENLSLVYPQNVLVEISLKTLDGEVMVLEVWHLSLQYLKEKVYQNDVDFEIQNNLVIPGEFYIHIYQKITSILKSLLTISRVMPSYKISRQQNHTDSTFAICYRFLPEENFIQYHNNMEKGRINTALLNLGFHSSKYDIGYITGIPLKIDNLNEHVNVPKIANISFKVYYRTIFTFDYPQDNKCQYNITKIIRDYNEDNADKPETLNINTSHHDQYKFPRSVIDTMFDPENYVAPAFANMNLYKETFSNIYKPDIEINVAKIGQIKKKLTEKLTNHKSSRFLIKKASKSLSNIHIGYDLLSRNNRRSLPSSLKLVDLINGEVKLVHPINGISSPKLSKQHPSEKFQPKSLPFGKMEHSDPYGFYHDICELPPTLKSLSYAIYENYQENGQRCVDYHLIPINHLISDFKYKLDVMGEKVDVFNDLMTDLIDEDETDSPYLSTFHSCTTLKNSLENNKSGNIIKKIGPTPIY